MSFPGYLALSNPEAAFTPLECAAPVAKLRTVCFKLFTRGYLVDSFYMYVVFGHFLTGMVYFWY